MHVRNLSYGRNETLKKIQVEEPSYCDLEKQARHAFELPVLVLSLVLFNFLCSLLTHKFN